MATITRSSVNSEQYAAPEHQKSGFDLSYTRHSSFALGRIHIGGVQYVMPGDKISGSSKFTGTFNRIVTPLITPVRAMSYQVFLPFRAIDTSFMKGMTPTVNNAMSANWSVPTITTKQLVYDILTKYGSSFAYNMSVIVSKLQTNYTLLDCYSDIVGTPQTQSQLESWLYNSSNGIITYMHQSLTIGLFNAMAKPLYLEDALLDIDANITVKLGSVDNPLDGNMQLMDFVHILLDSALTPFLGRYSYYGELKYNYLRPFDIYRASHLVGVDVSTVTDLSTFCDLFDDTPQSEYPLRVMYAIWYERFRNVDLEKVNSTLPDWREFGSISIFDLQNGGNLLYLIWRIRSWEKDMFTTAQIDDISRHVYAPVITELSSNVSYTTNDFNNLDTQDNSFRPSEMSSSGGSKKPNTYTIGYLNQSDGTNYSVNIPVPSNVNDILSDIDKGFEEIYGLDLNTLRQSQMLERYLKRNYLFGDEYQDRLLAHYNSRLSDMRINRPEILGQAINDMQMSQEISNVSTDETKVGDRTATATVGLSGDNYTTFIEEFGIIITLYTFMPRPLYDGICPQHLLTKQVDFPLPEFAANNEEFGRKMEIAASGLKSNLNGDDADDRFMFGRYPAYHAWRSRVDEVGGMFLDELQDATFRRFWGMFSDDTTPKLNYFFIHCRPNLSMFANTNLYDTQIYGDIINECYVERVLPTPVETI